MTRLARVLILGVLIALGPIGCSRSKADMTDTAQTDVATLGRLVTLHPKPVAATWSVVTIGTDGGLGPTDTVLWAVMRYAEADYLAITGALKAEPRMPPVTVGTPPAWVLADVDLARFRQGADYVIDGPVSTGTPFGSDLYSSGFALPLPDHRVLIRFSSQ